MTESSTRETGKVEQAEFGYLVFCFISMLAVTLALVNRGVGAWGLAPALFGGVAMALRWKSGPILVLVVMVWLWFADALGADPGSLLAGVLSWIWRFIPWIWDIFGSPMGFPNPKLNLPATRILRQHLGRGEPLGDFLLSAGVLGFSAGYFRWLSLVHQIFPVDHRSRHAEAARAGIPTGKPASIQSAPQKRSVRRIAPREIIVIAAMIPFWAGVAALVWLALEKQAPLPGMRLGVWRIVLLCWTGGLGLIAAWSMLGYLKLSRKSTGEGLLMLQDMLWGETRGDQRRVAAGLAKLYRKINARKE